jgi:CheY-like chemotaxis protein
MPKQKKDDQKTVMVVDDEKNIMRVMQMLLELEGYKVIDANDGPTALKKLRTDPLPDLALIDMFMPKMSGRQLCEEIRKDNKLKKLKIMFVTVADFSETGKEILKKLKVIDYIQKPFNNEDLIRRVKKALAQ